MDIHIIANVALGNALSGGDRIFIELARRWSKAGCKVHVYVWEEGYEMCKRNNLFNVNYIIWKAAKWKRFGFSILYLARTIIGIRKARKLAVQPDSIIYSASDFWPDSLPALTLKLRFKKHVKWVAGFYLFAPNPFTERSPYKGKRKIIGLLYYLTQLPIYWMVKRHADMVFVTNELDAKKFVSNRLARDKIVVVRGGVDTKLPNKIPEPKEKKYDAVFIGRFHPQKGVLELIDIWKKVCEKKPDASLAIIGTGPLENEIKEKIKKYGLENNIKLLGFKNGVEKIKIFKLSKIVVHPAIYDSGGMAPCEAMACGLPGVSFDLPALKTYYPKGMLKTLCYDLKAFAENILELLRDGELYERLSKEALELAKEWDWDKRADELLKAVSLLVKESSHDNIECSS